VKQCPREGEDVSMVEVEFESAHSGGGGCKGDLTFRQNGQSEHTPHGRGGGGGNRDQNKTKTIDGQKDNKAKWRNELWDREKEGVYFQALLWSLCRRCRWS
jgi:hypothetical protein